MLILDFINYEAAGLMHARFQIRSSDNDKCLCRYPALVQRRLYISVWIPLCYLVFSFTRLFLAVSPISNSTSRCIFPTMQTVSTFSSWLVLLNTTSVS